MNEDNNKSFLYEEEKKKLIKKLTIFGIITVIFTILFMVGTSEEGFFPCLMMGLLFGCVFYIPCCLASYLHMGWKMTIAVAVIFLLILIFLADKIGPVMYIVLLLPVLDIGYNTFRIIKSKKGGSEQ